MPGADSREIALQVLLDYQRKDAYLNTLLASRLGGSGLDRRDRAFVTELVQGTVRMLGTLDFTLGFFSDRPLDELDPWLLWILRIASYQVMFTLVPDYAACDTAVESAKGRVGQGKASYVNGVLRALIRGKDDVRYPDPREDPCGYLEARHSHPRWVAEMWIAELGFERAESICAADNRPPLTSLRCNLQMTRRDSLATSLKGDGFEVILSGLAPEGLLVTGGGAIGETDEYRAGYFALQDQGSMMVGHAVSPEPGMQVLDMCAAPGGKANHLAELMGNRGRVLALDINPRRLEQVLESASRLGNSAIQAREADAASVSGLINDRFDRVLLDAPCSGLGTLGRRPDIRWRKLPGDIERLAGLQRFLMEEASIMVREGGRLIYSTCTISERENRGVVSSFLENHPEFAPVDANPIVQDHREPPFFQLFPDADGCDGVFIAVMRRNA